MMVPREGLVDLSLFATFPTDDRHFHHVEAAPADPAPADRIFRARPGGHASIQYSHPLPRYYTMKPLPPLPSRRLCRRRGISRGPDFTSRCILTRMKRRRADDDAFMQGATIQQRRSGPATATPQLTLTLPPTSASQPNTSTSSAMIWMPDEQMWLIAEEITGRDDHAPNNFDLSAYDENALSYYQRPDYPRSEPSPGPYTYYDLTPPESPVMLQFRSLLVEPRDDERLSPLSQEATQTIPMSDSASIYTRSLDELEYELEHEQEEERQQSCSSEPSKHQSFHSAIEFLAGGPTRPYYRDRSGWSQQARKVARPSSAMA
ncbi:MAG: hypothetical protein LQ341_001837 [Variospora aurantia]|nr:MAG: hypothetical protein LQ341_001837 [Variospora aurantia]